jgi:hypothetical protein
MLMEKKKYKRIYVDNLFLEILLKLENKVKEATWNGMDKVSTVTLTRILANKINVARIV